MPAVSRNPRPSPPGHTESRKAHPVALPGLRRAPGEQVGPLLPGALERAGPPPALDLRVVAADEHVRGRAARGTPAGACSAGSRAAPAGRTRSPGDSAAPTTPGTSRVTASVTARAADSPPGRTKSPERDLLVVEAQVAHPLVDALVASAHEQHPLAPGEPHRRRVVERAPVRRHEDASSRAAARGHPAAPRSAAASTGAIMTIPAPPP